MATQPNNKFLSGSLTRSLLVAAAVSLAPSDVSAEVLYWDGTSTSLNADGGAGTWNTTTSNTNWDLAAVAGVADFWTNGDDAIFGWPGGAVSLGSAVTAGTVTVNSNGYTFSGSTLTLANLNIASGRIVTFNNSIAGVSNTLTMAGGYGSRADFGAASAGLSTININSGILRFGRFQNSSIANNAAITVGVGGEVQYNNVNPVPTSTNSVDITLNRGLFSIVGGDHAHVRNLTLNGGIVDFRSGGYDGESLALNGALTAGTGTFKGTSWLLQTTGDNTTRGLALNAASNTFTVAADNELRVATEIENGYALTKEGVGRMVLLNTSSHTGGTTVNNGVLQLGDLSAAGTGTGTTTSSRLGGATGNVTVNASGTLAASHVISSSTYLANVLAGSGTVLVRGAGHFILTGATNTFSGTANVESSGQASGGLTLDYTTSNTAKLASTATVNLLGGNFRLIGNASAATTQTVGAINVTGGGIITLNPGASQSITLNATTFAQSGAGTLSLRSSGVLGTTANLNVGAATLGRWATTQSTTETDTAFLTKNASNVAVALGWTATASGGATLASQAAGSVYLADSAQTLSSSLTIDSLASSANVNIDNSSTLTLSGGGLIVRNANHTIGQSAGRGNLTTGLASGDLYLTAGGSELNNFNINANIANNGAVATRLVKGGTGNVLIGGGGANSYTGGTIVNLGRLTVTNASGLGTGAVTVQPGGQVYLNAGNVTYANNFTLAGLGSSDAGANNYGALRVEGSPTISGNIAVANYARINVSTSGGTAAFNGILSGSGDLEIRNLSNGLSYAVFGNAGNTFTGRFIVRDGNAVLRMASDAAFGAVPTALRNDAIILDGGRLQAGTASAGADYTINANRGISLPNAGTFGYIHIWGGRTLTIASPISGPGSLAKTDSGTAVFSGLSPMTGNLELGGGTFQINSGGGFTNLGQIRFSSATTLNVAGALNATRLVTTDWSGSFTSTVNLQAGGTMTITGTESGQNTSASFLLQHWSGNTQFNISGGTLNVLGATMNLGWDGTGTLTQTGGEVNTLGIRFDSGRNNAFTYNLNGGRLNVGTSGIGANGSKTFNLGAGTLSALGNWSTSQLVNVTNAATGGTVDPAGLTITLTGGTAGSGKLILNGEGTLALNAASASGHSGGTNVVKGTLSIGNASALSATGTVDVSGGTISIGAVNADLGGTINLSAGSITGTSGTLASATIALTGGTLDALAASTVTINKTGAGAATISKAVAAPVTVSAGTLNLSAAITGALTVNGGTVVATAAPAGSVTLSGGIFDARTALSVAPTFSGGALTLGSGGSLAAGLGLSWSSGTVTVATGGTIGSTNSLTVGNGGTLAVTGTGVINSALVTVQSGGTLDVSGATNLSLDTTSQSLVIGRTSNPTSAADVVGSLSMAGARLNIAGTGTVGVATFGSGLTLGGGTLQFDLSDSDAGANDRINVLGALNLSGFALDVRKTAGALGNGSYVLINYGAGSSITTDFITILGASGSSPVRQSFTIADDTNLSAVVLNVGGEAASLVWSGGTSAWDYSTTANWKKAGADDIFYDQDNVTFDDTVGAGSTTATLSQALSPNSITVNGNTNFTFNGTGNITGTSTLTKSGTGTLTLANTGGNDFTGDTQVTGGTLALGAANALSANSELILGAGGTLDLSGNSAAVATLTGSGTLTSATAATLSAGGALGFTFSGNLAGSASLLKTGAGTLTFTGSSSTAGTVQVAGGIFQVGDGSTAGSLGSTSATIAEGALLAFNRSDALTQSGDFSRSSPTGTATLRQQGAGALTLSGAVTNVAVTHTGNGALTLSGALTGGSVSHSGVGALTLSGSQTGTALAISGSGDATLSGTFGSAAITKGGSGTLFVTGNASATSVALDLGTLNVSGTLSGNLVNNATAIFSGDAARSYGGAISGTGSVTKSGNGSLTLSGNNTFTGGLAVSGGRLIVSSASNLGSGSLTLSGGSVLELTTGLTTGRSLALGAGGGTLEVASGQTASHNSTITGGQTLVKAGAGQLNLSSYSGSNTAISVNAGTVRFGSGYFNTNTGISSIAIANGAVVQTTTHALGGYWAATPSINIAAGGRLELLNEQYLNTIVMDTATVNGGGEVRTDGSFSLTVNGGISTWSAGINTVNSNAAITVNSGAQLNLSGYVSNGRTLNKSGLGTLVLSGSNVYSGGTGVNVGTLVASSVADAGGAGSIGTGYLFVGSDATFRYTGTGSQTTSRALWIDNAGNAGTIDVAESTGSITFTSTAGLITRTLNKTGAGSLSIADNVDAAVTVSAGTLTLSGAVSGAINNSGTLSVSGAVSGAVTNSGTLTLSGAVSNTIANSGTLTLAGSGVTLASAISGTGSLAKSGAGTVTLSAINTFTGGTTVSNGVLVLATGGAAGALRGVVNVSSGATLRANAQDVTGYGTTEQITALNINGGTFDIATTANQTLGNAVITLTGGSITGQAGSNLDFFQTASALASAASSTASVVSGATLSIRQSAGLTITVADGAADDDLRIESAVRNNASFASAPLVKAGAGKLRLTGANTYTGATTISNGTLEIGGSGTLGNGSYAGAIANSGVLVFSTSANQTLSGTLSGSGTLTKSGTGTLSLTGTSSRSSATTLSGGVLEVASSALGTGAYAVDAGTLRLNVAASGTLNLANTITGSGILALNNTGDGTLAMSGLGGFLGSVALVSGVFDGSGFSGSYLYQGGRLLDTGNFSGVIEISSGTTVSVADLPSLAEVVLASGATLDFTNAPEAARDRTIKFSGGTISGAQNFTGTLEVVAGASVSVGASTLGQGKLLVAPSANVTFTETVTNLVTFSGGTITNGGNLRNIELASGGTLTLGSNIDALSSSATVKVSGGTLNLAGGAVASAIDFRGGTVQGAANFAGTLTVTAGETPVELVMNGTIGGTVQAGSNAVISGNGTFESLSLGSGSVLSPGNSPGIMTAENLEIDGGTTWVFQAFSTQETVAQGRGYDTVNILAGGSLDLSGASSSNQITLELLTLTNWIDSGSGQPTATSGIDFDAADASPLLFDLATFDTAGGLILGTGQQITSIFIIDNSGFLWDDGRQSNANQFSVILRELGDGRSALTLRVIPEPSTYGMILGGLALAAAAIRRRRARKA